MTDRAPAPASDDVRLQSVSASAPPRVAGLRQQAPLIYPALMLAVFFVVPFGIMLAVSFFHRVEGAFYEPAFELANYARFISPFFGRALAFSIWISGLAATIVVCVAFPFTYFLTRMRRGAQVRLLVFILAVLSLSEVIIGFSWSTLLSRTAGRVESALLCRPARAADRMDAELRRVAGRPLLPRIPVLGPGALSGALPPRPRAARGVADARRFAAAHLFLGGRAGAAHARSSAH